ncbi:MAG TPA: hypothetical protein PKI52_11760 [Aggregatilineales bacterium]|nr:hypothetical protein [Aggregatilineales bacterium]
MKKLSRLVTSLTALALIAVMVSACGGPAEEAPPPTPQPSPTPPPIPTDVPVTEDDAQPTPPSADSSEQPADQPISPVPSGSPDAGAIVYTSTRGGGLGLHLLAENGAYSAPIPLQGVDHATWPDVSPDGQRIVFAAVEATVGMPSAGIYVVSLTGGEAERIIAGDGTHPRWSPDGTQIAYTCNGGTDICRANADGSGAANLTQGSSATDAYPDWTADGRIVFMSDRDAPDGVARDIYVMDADGGNVRNLTANPADDAYPAVSPDGTKIAFTSDRDTGIGSSDIYVLELDTTIIRRVTVDDLWNQTPQWAPDNTTILFAAPDASGSVNLYSIGERAISATQLTRSPAEDGGLRLGHAWLPFPIDLDQQTRQREPDVSLQVRLPQGSTSQVERILFAVNDAGCSGCMESGIYIVDANGENLERLPVEGLYPVWASDFRRMAFVADGELFIANADGSNPVQVTHAFMNLGAIDWDRSGNKVVAECSPYGEPDLCLIDVRTGAVTNLGASLMPGEGTRAPYWWGDDIVVGTQIFNQAGELIDSLPGVGRVSADGRRLATIIDRQAAITNVDGSDPTTLTNGPATKGYPVWSPSMDRLLYTVAPGDGGLYLNVARVDGSSAFRLVPNAIAAGPATVPESLETFYGYSWGD